MKSTIRVEMDFDSGKPYLQINLPETHPMVEDLSLDLVDKTLRFFKEEASMHGVELVHRGDMNKPQIRILPPREVPSPKSIDLKDVFTHFELNLQDLFSVINENEMIRIAKKICEHYGGTLEMIEKSE